MEEKPDARRRSFYNAKFHHSLALRANEICKQFGLILEMENLRVAIAYFLTWTTYGSWLPGDARNWYKKRDGIQLPNPNLELRAALRQKENAVVLNTTQRQTVETTIACHCTLRKWNLHVVNCRTNHVHVVVTANCPPQQVRVQFKAWCTRKLQEHDSERKHWWSERGWDRFLDDEPALLAAIHYVRDCQ
jgi:Transposase IS200 like